MLRWSLLLGVLVWAGCGGGDSRTYRIAPYLEPGYSPCGICPLALTMRAQEQGKDASSTLHFHPATFEDEGFTFQWGVEQLVEIDVEEYDTDLQDDPGIAFHFQRRLESHPVDSDARFQMPFRDFGAGAYGEDFLVRDGDGFKLDNRARIECDSTELCDQLAGRSLGMPPFSLELSYPATEGGPLQLHAVQDLP